MSGTSVGFSTHMHERSATGHRVIAHGVVREHSAVGQLPTGSKVSRVTRPAGCCRRVMCSEPVLVRSLLQSERKVSTRSDRDVLLLSVRWSGACGLSAGKRRSGSRDRLVRDGGSLLARRPRLRTIERMARSGPLAQHSGNVKESSAWVTYNVV